VDFSFEHSSENSYFETGKKILG